MSTRYSSLDTKLIHAGEPSPRIKGAVEAPIFQSAMFEYDGEAGYHDLGYIRLNNTPNHQAVHAKLAALEGSEAALVTASGMAGISTTLFTVLSAGDSLLAQSTLYGGTHDLITSDFAKFGLSFDFINADDRTTWRKALRPQTKAIYVEAMTNPLLEVADLRGIVEFAREHGLISIIDNTFASPVNFRPIEAGFDLCIHSATKYLNGHADIVGGAVAGRADMIERIRHKLNHLGGCMDPHTVFLLSRGLKTLALRVRHQNQSALKIAQFLESHRTVARVNYAGLERYARHARARDLFGGFGGVLSFELRASAEATDAFMRRTTIPVVAPSLGGVQTLLIRPAVSSHAGMTRDERLKAGITDGLVRMSVGIEDADELIEDLSEALSGIDRA
jgi:cystathionine beta-lyase/cystathionine gamma-synthase